MTIVWLMVATLSVLNTSVKVVAGDYDNSDIGYAFVSKAECERAAVNSPTLECLPIKIYPSGAYVR